MWLMKLDDTWREGSAELRVEHSLVWVQNRLLIHRKSKQERKSVSRSLVNRAQDPGGECWGDNAAVTSSPLAHSAISMPDKCSRLRVLSTAIKSSSE